MICETLLNCTELYWTVQDLWDFTELSLYWTVLNCSGSVRLYWTKSVLNCTELYWTVQDLWDCTELYCTVLNCLGYAELSWTRPRTPGRAQMFPSTVSSWNTGYHWQCDNWPPSADSWSYTRFVYLFFQNGIKDSFIYVGNNFFYNQIRKEKYNFSGF